MKFEDVDEQIVGGEFNLRTVTCDELKIVKVSQGQSKIVNQSQDDCR